MTTSTAAKTDDHLDEAAWPDYVRAGDIVRTLQVSHDAAYALMHRAGAIVLGPKCLRLPRGRLIEFLRRQDAQ